MTTRTRRKQGPHAKSAGKLKKIDGYKSIAVYLFSLSGVINLLALTGAMYMLRSELHLSFPKIARELGRKDHTTAIHSVEKIEKEASGFVRKARRTRFRENGGDCSSRKSEARTGVFLPEK